MKKQWSNRCINAALLALLLLSATQVRAHAPGWAKVQPLIPGATLTHELTPLDAKAIAHLSHGTGVKFTGSEAKWHIYNATQNGRRGGMGALTHGTLSGGTKLDMAFAVDTKFRVTRVAVVGAPAASKAKIVQFVKQFRGKSVRSALKAGKDLKSVPGLSSKTAQSAADLVHKGLLMMDEFFNAAHGDAH